MTRSDHLITTAELLAKLGQNPNGSGATEAAVADLAEDAILPPRLLDVRWTLPKPDGRDEFAVGHIPGAIYVDLDTDLADHSNTNPVAGRHPLPSPEEFQKTLRRWGIDSLSEVVVYDDNSGFGAARAWWLLRWAGISVRVLDGGLSAYVAAGGTLDIGPGAAVEPSNVTITSGQMPEIDADEVASWSGPLLDARAGERFRGEVEPLDSRAGHIPGALSAPVTENVADGFFLDEETLRERFAGFGVDSVDPHVAVYCGSGVTACHNALALATIGVESSLYPASWSGWSSDPERPAAIGA